MIHWKSTSLICAKERRKKQFLILSHFEVFTFSFLIKPFTPAKYLIIIISLTLFHLSQSRASGNIKFAIILKNVFIS